MQEARIGGVELQILYPLQPDDEEKGIHNYEYLSPGFMDMIRFAADEAAKRDMQFDLTLGSSWPFGGPFLKEELSGQSVLPFTIDVEGPCTFYKGSDYGYLWKSSRGRAWQDGRSPYASGNNCGYYGAGGG